MKRLAAGVVIALSVFCGWWATSHAKANPASQSLSPKDRIEVFETIWKTINDEYYDSSFNGVDWAAVRERYLPRVEAAKTDGEFYALINQALRELHDIHTAVAAPDDQPQNN